MPLWPSSWILCIHVGSIHALYNSNDAGRRTWQSSSMNTFGIPKNLSVIGSHVFCTMLEGNISSLLSSLLSKVFEEKCLTKENLQSDIYNGWVWNWRISSRTHSKRRNPFLIVFQFLWVLFVALLEHWKSNCRHLQSFQMNRWNCEFVLSFSLTLRLRIFAWLSNQSMIILSRTRFVTTM